MAAGPNFYSDIVWKHTKGNVNKKLEDARPYGLFLTPIDEIVSTHTEALTLSFPGTFLLILAKVLVIKFVLHVLFSRTFG